MEEEFLKLEEQFAEAIIKNDPGAIERLVTDDWIIINADGGIIDKVGYSNSRDDGVR